MQVRFYSCTLKIKVSFTCVCIDVGTTASGGVMKTAERINELLRLKGWSQAELARQLEEKNLYISRQALQRIYHHDNLEKTRLETIIKLAVFFNWYEVNIVDTILLIKVDNYEDFLKYSVGDKYPSLFCILSLLYQPSMNSNIASFVSS